MCVFNIFVVQSHVWLFVTPWTAAYQASLSFTISQSLFKFLSIELVMLSNYLPPPRERENKPSNPMWASGSSYSWSKHPQPFPLCDPISILPKAIQGTKTQLKEEFLQMQSAMMKEDQAHHFYIQDLCTITSQTWLLGYCQEISLEKTWP